VQICLNLGPLKTADWPEVHVPEGILAKHQPLPTWPQELPSSHPLVQEAGEYLHRLCTLLKKELPLAVQNSISMLQLNNEGYNPFGELTMVMGIDTEVYFESIASTYFPGRQILFNTPGKLQAGKILQTQARLLRSKTPTVLGIDYYYHTPTNDYPIIKYINQLHLPLPWTPSMRSIKKNLTKNGNHLEFTEVQMEKWGHIEYPGTSPQALQKVIDDLSRYKPAHQKTLLLRLWGVEIFADTFLQGKQTLGMKQMLDIIRAYSR
jgi:hypothetical protein